MKKVAIFQHDETQGPGYLQQFLERQEIPYQIFRPAQGESVPASAFDFSGLVFLGSPHSVNENELWMELEANLIRHALHNERPVLGHCFGAQLLAKTLGAEVLSNPQPHIGWGKVMTTHFQDTRQWFGETESFSSFHWHYQSFTMPPAATRLLYGQYSLNKAFCLGKHIGLQCHLEVTEDIVREWCRSGAREIALNAGETVQGVATILDDLPAKLAALHRLSERVYTHWSEGLVRPVTVAMGTRGWHEAIRGNNALAPKHA